MAFKTKRAAMIWLLCGLLCLCVGLAGCVNNNTDSTPPQTTQPVEAIYTISVKTAGGMVPQNLDYYVYTDSDRTDVEVWGSLPADGIITFTAPRSDKYVLQLEGVPEGYDLKEYYTLTGAKTDVVLTSSVIKDANATDRVYKLGDVVCDFTVVDTDGNVLTLSEILKTKDAVVLNFWYTNCPPCKNEFPYLQTAYDLYSDKLEVIAMDPYMDDNEADIAAFKQQYGLTFPMVDCDQAWIRAMGVDAYPKTVFIDRYGVICLMERGSITEEGVFEGAFNHFTAEDYTQKLVSNIEELDTLDYPDGHKRNPLQVFGTQNQFQITVEPGKPFYCNIFQCEGLLFRVQNKDIYVMNGQTRHDPNGDGVISFEMKQSVTGDLKLEFHNPTEETKIVTVEMLVPPGTSTTPIEMSYGTVDVLLKLGNNKGMHYTMIADQSGYIVFTVTKVTAGLGYDIRIDNVTSTHSTNFNESCGEDEEGNLAVSVAVNEGDKLHIVFMSEMNASGIYPETYIKALVSYSEDGGVGAPEDMDYTLIFKDIEGLPMAGVTATFTVNGKPVVGVSDENGIITLQLPAGSYLVQLVFPTGFTADSAQYLLTAEENTKEVIVRLFQEKEIDYTIHVEDHDGLPVANAVVTVGTSYMRTDENGNAVFHLPVGSYRATIVPPNGYTAREESYAFGARPDVTIVLINNTSASKIPYTVIVKDGYGKPYKAVMVRFYAEDGSYTMAEVSDEGVAEIKLIRGNYTVELLFEKDGMRYSQAGLQLTADVTMTTIVVAPGVAGKTVKVTPVGSASTYQAYYLQVGNNFVDVQALALTYFVFKPTETGIYKFYTNKVGAQVENWQTLAQPMENTSGVENNVFTLEVTELGQTYVIGIDAAYDVTDAIVTVFRVPDCVVEEFVGTTVPELPYTAPVMIDGQYIWLDLTGRYQFVLGEDGFYHLDTADGPVVLIDLRGMHYGISIEQLLTGEMAYYTYDEDGYPIHKKDFSACMNAYLSMVDPVNGMYPLTTDLYEMLNGYGELMGWWDPTSENYLFAAQDLLVLDSGWLFLACVMQENPEVCQHQYGQWYLSGEDTYLVHRCALCFHEEIHMVGSDCNADTMDPWALSADMTKYTANCTLCGHVWEHVVGTDCTEDTCDVWTMTEDETSYVRNCLICHAVHTHIIDTDCTEEHFSQWELGQDQVNFVRHCTICGKEEIHYVDTDCQNCFGEWELSEDELNYIRSCTICGKEEIHAVHGDCAQEHFSAWELSEDELNYVRSCTICGKEEIHAVHGDCAQEHFSAWELSEDELNYIRSCAICGKTETHVIDTDCLNCFTDWVLAEDQLHYERSCTICGKIETHVIDVDCEDHYSQWTDCEDGIHQERICDICGNTQTQQIQPDEPVVTPVYTVTVVDQNGNAVPGVYVQLWDDNAEDSIEVTGEDGVVVFEKEGLVGAKAKVVSAEGYTFSEEWTYFVEAYAITIIIEKQAVEIGSDVGQKLPGSELNIITGEGITEVTMDPTTNGKITVINFWGIWDGPCVNELPDFDQIATDFADSVIVVAVHTDMMKDAVPEYIQTNYPETEVIFLLDNATMDYYYTCGGESSSYPYTVLIDENGVVVAKIVGSTYYEELEEILQLMIGTSNEEEVSDIQ